MSRFRISPRGRLILLAASLPVLNVLAALVYMVVMGRLEGEPRTFLAALEWAAETLTTTGYGADASWDHPVSLAFVISMQFLGVFLVFLIVPIYLVPFLEERFQARLPRTAARLNGHLLVYRSDLPILDLMRQWRRSGRRLLVMEPDPARARELMEEGWDVLARKLDEESLAAASLSRARAFLANGSDSENAEAALVARQAGFEGEILAMAEDPSRRRALQQAGATRVLTPRFVLGEALAERVSRRVRGTEGGARRLGSRLQVREIKVRSDTEMAGRTLAEAALPRRTGATILGLWVEGSLHTEPNAETRLIPGAIAVAAGTESSLDQLQDLLEETAAALDGPVILCGYGEVGGKVHELLRQAEIEVVVLDRQPRPGVDLVGDVLDPEVLARAEPGQAGAVVLALHDDTSTLFAVLEIRAQWPEVPIFARVNESENVERIYRAGADFGLAISEVSGRILARELLGEDAISIDYDLKLRKVSGDSLAGRRLDELDLRRRTGCSAVAVERDSRLIVQLGPGFRFETGDVMYVCGSSDAVDDFEIGGN